MRAPSRLLLLRLVLATLGPACASTAAFSWTPPLGIPAPSFGIDQTTTDIAFTHWVDNSGLCSDALNNRGTPVLPRCTIPDTLAAGSIVQVRGGPYSLGDEYWSLNGTAGSPVYVRGPSTGPRPNLGPASEIELDSRYAIIENLRMTSIFFDDGATIHHTALRHLTVTDNPGTGAAVAAGDDNHDLVIWDCEIARNGTIPSGADNHGIALHTEGVNHVWIVDNHIHHNSGDGIQFCHGCSGGPANVYIGRNDIHHDEENAIDIKAFIGPVIISQNSLHDYQSSADSNGDALRINDEGEQHDFWILFNDIYNAELGINAQGSFADNIYIIGNELHGLGSAILGIPDVGSSFVKVINNTLFDVDEGILVGQARSNIVRTTVGGLAIGEDVTLCTHNLVQRGTIEPTCTLGRSGDPKFLMSGGHVVGLAADSPAIDTGLDSPQPYTTFQSTFGRSIHFDRLGVPRPSLQGWDIGANERQGDVIFGDGF
jgi:hypothetical protein